MNKKPMILAIASLGSVALIGTGFAGWVISTEATADGNGTITAYTVTDNRVRIDDEGWVGDESNANSIVFGKPSTGADTGWFKADSDVAVEKLSAHYHIDLWSSVKAAPSIVATSTVAGEGYDAALTANYIAGPAVGENVAIAKVDTAPTTTGIAYVVTAGAETTTPAVGQKFTIDVYFNFDWGTEFGGKNPYTYFSDFQANAVKTTGVTYADFAKASMDVVATANSATFSFAMTINPGTATTNN